MKLSLSNAPIRSKLRFIILSTCIVSLLVACGVLFAVQFYIFRKNFIQDVTSTSEMIASQSTAVIDFENQRSGEELLTMLSVKNSIVGAKLLLKNGNVLSAYGALGPEIEGRTPGRTNKQWWANGNLLIEIPIIRDGEHIGTLYAKADYQSQSQRLLNLCIGIFCMVLAISVLVAWVISVRLGKVISTPIQMLAQTAHAIAASDRYDARAVKMGTDEVGAFTDTFNFMLDQVQFRDTALRHEIAERERAERELQQMQAQLIQTSHQAGMAEVATGVLHNVGNVLNSVNVSAALISEKLHGGRLEKLQKTATLMLEKNGGLGEFVSKDPKGKVIPSYLANLSTYLISERNEALSELESLSRNIEHIKEIVAMQQSHARVFGVLERIQPEELVDDAIRMVAISLRRHQIELVRVVSNSKPVDVDRHKVLQILVNLLRNSKHAMEASSSDMRRITVQVCGEESGTVKITVSDTGCGIQPENLTKIFSHGFTTRKDGHGFGLHSAALAAKQMGGHLTANSAGVGHGASFILELPSVTQEVLTA